MHYAIRAVICGKSIHKMFNFGNRFLYQFLSNTWFFWMRRSQLLQYICNVQCVQPWRKEHLWACIFLKENYSKVKSHTYHFNFVILRSVYWGQWLKKKTRAKIFGWKTSFLTKRLLCTLPSCCHLPTSGQSHKRKIFSTGRPISSNTGLKNLSKNQMKNIYLFFFIKFILLLVLTVSIGT